MFGAMFFMIYYLKTKYFSIGKQEIPWNSLKKQKKNKKSGRFIFSPSFFYSVDDTKLHQIEGFYVAIESADSKMSNSAFSPSSFGVQKRSLKSQKMLRTEEIAEIWKMV